MTLGENAAISVPSEASRPAPQMGYEVTDDSTKALATDFVQLDEDPKIIA